MNSEEMNEYLVDKGAIMNKVLSWIAIHDGGCPKDNIKAGLAKDFTELEVNEAKEELKKYIEKKHLEIAADKAVEKFWPHRRVNRKSRECKDVTELLEILTNYDKRPVFLLSSEEAKQLPRKVDEDWDKESINSKIAAIQNILETVNEKVDTKAKEIIQEVRVSNTKT